MSKDSIDKLLPDLIRIGWGTAELLQSHASQIPQDLGCKEDSPVTAADLASNQYILEELHQLTGDRCGYLSEETYQGGFTPLPEEWVWIIDPLDGTKDFISGNGEYAVHIALTYQGRPELAIVVLPAKSLLFYAHKGHGCYELTKTGNKRLLQVAQNKSIEDLIVVASRNHRNPDLEDTLKNLPCTNQRSVGSIGGKIAAIITQEADLYISISGKSAPKDWDLAAPELILTEAGGKLTKHDGSNLTYNSQDISQWGCLVASNGEHHQDILSLVKYSTP